MKARAYLFDGSMQEISIGINQTETMQTVFPIINDWSVIRYLDIGYDMAEADAGDIGYYAIPGGTGSPDDHLCCFDAHPDAKTEASGFHMPMFGYVHGNKGFCAIVTGYTYEYHLFIEVKNNHYTMFPRFFTDGKAPYEEIRVEFRFLEGSNADYNGIAKAYRTYLLTECGVYLLRDRLTPELSYAADSMYIRIRQAWKPVPSPVKEQTEENEPPIHVAIDFDRVGILMEKCKAAGIEKAEFCLVGWNKSGHDGRWPQSFPVEPLLGGEEKLCSLIQKAKNLGYAITCHSNSTDCYTIADSYSDDIVLQKPDGSQALHPICWGGGLPRYVCPEKAWEIAKKELPKIAALGFRGLHYIDVISSIPPMPCYAENHPVNRRQAVRYAVKIANLTRQLFGGFSSEGGYDYTLPYLDYGLYVSFFDSEKPCHAPLFTKTVPLWQIALHGIVMSNPYTSTVNAPVKSRKHQLELIERGGRPTIYLYSKFKSDQSSWMGKEDLICTTDEDLETTVHLLSEFYKEQKELFYLQTLQIDRHEELAENVYQITYEDGSKITVNYPLGTYSLEKPESN